MKKLLCSILCICILLSNLSVGVLASSTPVLSVVCDDTCLGGDTITVAVNLNNAADYAAVSCRLQYDSSKMSVVAGSAVSSFSGLVTINETYSENEVFVSYAGSSAVSTSGALLTVQFKVNNAVSGAADFSLTNVKLRDVNSEAMDIAAENASIDITENPVIVKPVIEADSITTGETLSFNVVTNNLSEYCAVSFRVQYDPAKFEISGITQGEDFSGGQFTVNTAFAENEAFMSYTLYENISTNGALGVFEFVTKDNVAGDAAFKITNLKVYDENSVRVSCESGEDSITVVCSHKGAEWVETKAPSCTAEGEKTFSCACGYSAAEPIEKTDHTYVSEIIPPSASEDGYTKYTCFECGDTYTDTPVSATGYTVTYNANGGSFTVESQNKPHDVDLVLTSEIPTRDGYNFLGWASSSSAAAAEYAAGAAYSANADITLYAVWEEVVTEVQPSIPDKMGASLVLENEVLMNVKFFLENIEGTMDQYTDRVGVLIWKADELPAEAIYENCDTIVTDVSYDTSSKCLVATCPGIPAKELGDALAIRAFYRNDDGTYTYGKLVPSYSPKTYCYNMLKNTNVTDDALMVSILNYGAAAQVYFGHNTDSLMNADLTEAQKALNWDGSLVRSDWSVPASKEGAFTQNTEVITGRGASLTLVGAIDYNYKFRVSGITVKSAKVLCWTESDYNAADVLTKENATLIADAVCTSSNAQYEYTYEGLPAKEMFSPIYACAEITDTNGNVYYSGILPYCPERFSYVNHNKTDEATANLAKRIAIYGDAARAYFG